MRPGNSFLTDLNTFTSNQSIIPRIGIYGEADYHSELRLFSSVVLEPVTTFGNDENLVKDDKALQVAEHFESFCQTTRNILAVTAVVGGIVSFFVPAVAPVAIASGVAAAGWTISANYISTGIRDDWGAIIHNATYETHSYYYEELVYDCPANYHGAAWKCPSHFEGHTGYYDVVVGTSDDGLLSKTTQQRWYSR